MAKLVFWSILPFMKWFFVNCSAFCSCHFCVSFSGDRLSERIEGKFKTQNPNHNDENNATIGRNKQATNSDSNPCSIIAGFNSKIGRILVSFDKWEIGIRPVHVLLSRFYPDFILTLSWFYLNKIWIKWPLFFANFIQILSRFYSDF